MNNILAVKIAIIFVVRRKSRKNRLIIVKWTISRNGSDIIQKQGILPLAICMQLSFFSTQFHQRRLTKRNIIEDDRIEPDRYYWITSIESYIPYIILMANGTFPETKTNIHKTIFSLLPTFFLPRTDNEKKVGINKKKVGNNKNSNL